MTKQYYCVDLLKFICALLVVALHVSPFSSYSVLLDYGICSYIGQLAVPFFFVCSGFFLFRKTSLENFDKRIPLRYAARIFRLYVIWTIIYLPLILYFDILRDEKGFVHGMLFWLQKCIFTGSFRQLWYLNATIVATLILTGLLCRSVKLKRIIVLAAVLYAIGLLPQTYYVLLKPFQQFPAAWTMLKSVQKVILTTRNGVFVGVPFVGIGMFYAYKPIEISLKKASIGFCVSMVLLFIEMIVTQYFGWSREQGTYIFLVPAVYFMFYLAAHIELKPNKAYKYLRNMSILIYFVHMYVEPFVSKGYELLGMVNSLLRYTTVVLIAFVISHIILKLSGTKQFAWLKVLYS